MWEPSKLFNWERVSTSDSSAVYSWTVPPELPYFEGHFPENPIVPAVGIIDATLVAIAKESGPHRLKGIKRSKFLGPILPNDHVVLSLEKAAPGNWKASWTVEDHSGKPVKKVEIVLETY